MELEFIYNEYILMWNLLFRKSINEELNSKKQKIWYNYRNEYDNLYNEKLSLIEDPKNYIPDDDTIYNILRELSIYEEIDKDVSKYRIELMKSWDSIKKKFNKYIKELLRVDLKSYKIYVVDKRLDVTDIVKLKDGKSIIFGREGNEKDEIIDLLYDIIKSELGVSKDNEYIVDAVLNLIVRYETRTRLEDKNYYKNLSNIEREIYPYFLMYMGVDEKDFPKYEEKYNIYFSVPYNDKLKNMNIFSFIDFCIKKERYTPKIEEIEVL